MNLINVVAILSAVIAIIVFLIPFATYFRRNISVRMGMNETYLSVESRLSNYFDKSKQSIHIVGVTLWNIFGRKESSIYKSLVNAALRGIKIRILILDPELKLDIKEPDLVYYTDHKKLAKQITIKTYLELKNNYPNIDLELRYYKPYITYSFIIADDTVFMSERHSPDSHRYFIISQSKALSQKLSNNFSKLWKTAIEVR